MAGYIIFCLFCIVVPFYSVHGQRIEDPACRRELGACTQLAYNNTRLAALRSSDCHMFCQCVHEPTKQYSSPTYMWVKLECPPTTLFDDSLPEPVCNHAVNVKCHGDDDEDCSSEYGECTRSIYYYDRLLAHKSSGCKKFCQCAHASTQLDGSVTYQWIEHTCPSQTLFDNSISVCNFADRVRCDEYPESRAFVPGEDNNKCFEEYGYCSFHQYENVRLIALRSSGCKHFCQCAPASTDIDGYVTYKWVTQTCPDNTLFDESLPAPVCNHDYNVKCPNEESEDCTTEHGTCTYYMYEEVRLVPKRSSGCKTFCQCAHASTELDGSVTYKWVEHDCPEGLLFDANLRVCNYPGAVECHSNGNQGQNEHTTTPRPWVQETTTVATEGMGNKCFEEYGYCSFDQYENVRLIALRSSGCKHFCQCAPASTELDGSVTYKWVTQTCPDNTLFDESLPAPVCNHDYKVKCPNEESEDCTTEHGTCTYYMYEEVRLVPKRSSGCKKFCQCAHASTELDGSVTYKWVEHDCPEGLLFDANLRVCNYPDEVECHSNGNQGQNEYTTTARPWVQETTTVATEGDGNKCFEEYGYCSFDQYENVRLIALRSSGCKHFCQCAPASTELDGSVTYKWVTQTCPDNTLFDESLPAPVCNHDYKVKCPNEESEDCTTEHGTCTYYMYEEVRLVPKRSSGCTKFCQCAHASTELDGSVTYKWVEHDCPEGLLFDADLRVCNYPGEVECHSNGNQGQNEHNTTPRPWVPETTTVATEENGNKCFEEYGYCSFDQYENVRLIALRSSGCKHFCQCATASTEIDGSVTYKWVTKTCPGNTLFDESLPAPVCNHDYEVKCPNKESEDCTTEYGTCTDEMYEDVRLVPKRSSGCEKFCQCAYASTELDGSVTYKWVEHDCPEGLLFDANLKVCNYPDQVECYSSGNFEEERTLELLREETALLGNPELERALELLGEEASFRADDEDCFQEYGTCTSYEYEYVRVVALRSSGCKNFCHCAHASTLSDGSVTYKWVKQTCGENTLFDQNPLVRVCNHEYMVQCPSIIAEEDGCWTEHGTCTENEYTNKRLTALKSSGCKKFCQCAFASTERDGSVTYSWKEQTCDEKTLFDESLPTPVCNWDYNVRC